MTSSGRPFAPRRASGGRRDDHPVRLQDVRFQGLTAAQLPLRLFDYLCSRMPCQRRSSCAVTVSSSVLNMSLDTLSRFEIASALRTGRCALLSGLPAVATHLGLLDLRGRLYTACRFDSGSGHR